MGGSRNVWTAKQGLQSFVSCRCRLRINEIVFSLGFTSFQDLGELYFSGSELSTKDDYQIYYKYYSTQTLGFEVGHHLELAFCRFKMRMIMKRCLVFIAVNVYRESLPSREQ